MTLQWPLRVTGKAPLITAVKQDSAVNRDGLSLGDGLVLR